MISVPLYYIVWLVKEIYLADTENGDPSALDDLQMKMLLISAMHFMDPYNFDLKRPPDM